MRSIFAALAIAALVLAQAACEISTLSSVYTPDTIVTDDRLDGLWEMRVPEPDGELYVEFSGRPDRSYSLRMTPTQPRPDMCIDPSKVFRLRATLARVGPGLYLDLELPSEDLDRDDPEMLFLLPVHRFYKIDLSETKLVAMGLNPEELKTWIKRNPGRLSALDSPESPQGVATQCARTNAIPAPPVLTSRSDQVQAFLLENGEHASMWTESYRLERVPRPAAR